MRTACLMRGHLHSGLFSLWLQLFVDEPFGVQVRTKGDLARFDLLRRFSSVSYGRNRRQMLMDTRTSTRPDRPSRDLVPD